ncbi:cyclin-H1 [Raphidocelis subcapitata]|uniref:Cyclin-H1 n=1 Tax=Raphidocelis subcapitata TaxID=307507 RepID=A0A2V0NR09_9CHLO|nr:cyclin-H1 [Raphidocelis subcapitata]|eukprot:GBF89062.1 cyclin-H1 [Raphidocelis subcapitata]
MDFAASTHRARWIFDQDSLVAKREAAQQKAAESLKRSREPSPAAGGDDGAPQPDAKKPRADVPVSAGEEAVLRRYFELRIRAVCEAYPLPPKVAATATAYFKRFYVQRSCLEHDPSRIMPTCIYVEEAYVGAEDFCKKLGLEPQSVLRTEVPLLQGLGFDLVVHSPYRALAGLLQELEELRAQRAPALDAALLDAPADAVAKLSRGANKAVAAILQSDAPLLYPPGVLALAALRSGARTAGVACGAFVEHAAARAAAERAAEAAAADAAAESAAGAGPIPGGENPVPEHLRLGGSEADRVQQLLAWLGEIDACVVAAMKEEEGLEPRATEIDRTIKLWRKAAAAPLGGGGGGGAAAAVAAAAGGGGTAAGALAGAAAVPAGAGAAGGGGE